MDRYIIDANVVLLAGTPVGDIPDDQVQCARKCVTFIHDFMNNQESQIVLDSAGEILKEYRKEVGREPNLATEFYKWVSLHIAQDPVNFIYLNKISENEYDPYPEDKDLREFDPPDRKYIALSYAHPENPPILEGTDSKWWGIREQLSKNGIPVIFVDEEYIKNKYEQKIGS